MPILLLGTILVSCKKEHDKIQQTYNLEKIKSDLSLINEQNKPKYNQTAWSFKKFCAIFTADVGGAWAGSWAGGKIGGAVGSVIPGAGTAAGASAGAVAGAVVVGAAASYAASYTAVPVGTDPKTYDKVLRSDIDFILENPEGNPFYEVVGKRHNELLKQNLVINKGSTGQTISELYSSCSLLDNEKILLAEGRDITDYVYHLLQNDNNPDELKRMLALKIDNELVLTIANSFVDGAYTTNNSEEAIRLTVEYERYVNSLDGISPIEKQTLFSGFAVAKYSSKFWSQIMLE